jgi:hypothetical protein
MATAWMNNKINGLKHIYPIMLKLRVIYVLIYTGIKANSCCHFRTATRECRIASWQQHFMKQCKVAFALRWHVGQTGYSNPHVLYMHVHQQHYPFSNKQAWWECYFGWAGIIWLNCTPKSCKMECTQSILHKSPKCSVSHKAILPVLYIVHVLKQCLIWVSETNHHRRWLPIFTTMLATTVSHYLASATRKRLKW